MILTSRCRRWRASVVVIIALAISTLAVLKLAPAWAAVRRGNQLRLAGNVERLRTRPQQNVDRSGPRLHAGGAAADGAAGVGRVVILGAGLHGAALAYYLTLRGVKPIVVEQKEVAAAASGKGGGFLARDWGSGATTKLHKVSFALHKELAETLDIKSYRKMKAVCVCLGPWAALAQDWFHMAVPMTGIRSTSIVFKTDAEVEPYALFCGEDDRFNTHLEVYPRNSGEVYLCGIGGSEYVDGKQLRAGQYPPGEVFPDPARIDAATKSFNMMSKKLGGTPAVTQACMRPCPPDAMPIMGKVAHIKGAYISAGHNCWGILWSPVSGKAMSELIIDGYANCVDLSAFKPGRFDSSGNGNRGGRGRKMGSTPVGEQW